MGSIDCELALSLCHDGYKSMKVVRMILLAFASEST